MKMIDADAFMKKVREIDFMEDAKIMKVGFDDELTGFFRGTIEALVNSMANVYVDEDHDDACYIDKVEVHKEICNRLNDTYKAKNADYGDSFAKLRDEFPDAILIRLTDKMSRLKTLMGGADQKVSDESIDDTLLDLANYAIMELVERKVKR